MREVVTVQLGDFANFTGSHYWNLLDASAEYCHTHGPQQENVQSHVFHQEKLTEQGQSSWAPRLLAIAARDSFAGSSLIGSAAYAENGLRSEAVSWAWDGQMELHETDLIARSEYNELLETEDAEPDSPALGNAIQGPLERAAKDLDVPGAVTMWTDFIEVLLPTKAVFTLPDIWHGSTSFGGFTQGMGILTLGDREEILDRARLLGEACDSPQGLQMLVDDMSGFGGLAANILPDLKDAIGIQTVLTFALRATRDAPARSTQQGTAQAQWQLNEALSMACLSSETSLFTPMASPAHPSNQLGLQWDPDRHYHTSALCAAALDNMTFPLRAGSPRSTGSLTMAEVVQLLAIRPSANLATMSGRMPAPIIPPPTAESQQDTDFRTPMPQCQPLQPPCMAQWTPGLQASQHTMLSESLTVRGAACNGTSASRSMTEEYLQQVYMTEGLRCRRHTCVSALGMQLPLPFPAVFRNISAPQMHAAAGALSIHQGLQQGSAALNKPRSCSMLSRWAASQSFGPYVDGILTRFQEAHANSLGQTIIRNWECDEDIIAAVKERLQDMIDSFN
ncbi:hypothetical protein WJX84_010017 [Apatococcus fuscideae]|uniref:Misato Segment II tubulin-like domain-containing protein n=1 Tax=Apatococcus fuscideae TaxID=2026836 RepID=A0AAW1T0N9_9CHLO